MCKDFFLFVKATTNSLWVFYWFHSHRNECDFLLFFLPKVCKLVGSTNLEYWANISHFISQWMRAKVVKNRIHISWVFIIIIIMNKRERERKPLYRNEINAQIFTYRFQYRTDSPSQFHEIFLYTGLNPIQLVYLWDFFHQPSEARFNKGLTGSFVSQYKI